MVLLCGPEVFYSGMWCFFLDHIKRKWTVKHNKFHPSPPNILSTPVIMQYNFFWEYCEFSPPCQHWKKHAVDLKPKNIKAFFSAWRLPQGLSICSVGGLQCQAMAEPSTYGERDEIPVTALCGWKRTANMCSDMWSRYDTVPWNSKSDGHKTEFEQPLLLSGIAA